MALYSKGRVYYLLTSYVLVSFRNMPLDVLTKHILGFPRRLVFLKVQYAHLVYWFLCFSEKSCI